MEYLQVEVRDLINGFCPSCPSPDIQLAETSCGGNGIDGVTVIKFDLYCSHIPVCKWRDAMAKSGVVKVVGE